MESIVETGLQDLKSSNPIPRTVRMQISHTCMLRRHDYTTPNFPAPAILEFLGRASRAPHHIHSLISRLILAKEVCSVDKDA